MLKIEPMDKNNSIVVTGRARYLFSAAKLKVFRIDDAFDLRSDDLSSILDRTYFDDLGEPFKKGIDRFCEQRTCSPDNLVLSMTNSCNLSCTYCFEENGSKKSEGSLSVDRGKAAVDILLGPQAVNGKRKSITFFGGEPLLNFSAIKKIIEYAEARSGNRRGSIEYSVTTNAVLLNDEMFDFFDRTDTKILVSIDGDREIHDRHRKKRNGSGSYDDLLRILSRYIPRRADLFYGRATITPFCTDIVRIVKHIQSLGIKTVYFSAEDCSHEHNRIAWTEDLIDEYDRQYGSYMRMLRSEILKGVTDINYNIYDILMSLRRSQIHVVPCQISTGILSVSPDGGLYPCQRLVGCETALVGTVDEGIEASKIRPFFPKVVYEKESCSECWARFLCSGSCPALSIEADGSDENPDQWSCRVREIECKWILWLFIQLIEDKYSFDKLKRK